MMKNESKIKNFFKVDPKVQQEEQNRPKGKKVLKRAYNGVKIPWGQMIFGYVIGIAAVAVAALQTESLTKFAAGEITNIADVISYAVFSFLTWFVTMFAISAPLGEVKVATRMRKKIWNKVMRLPVSYFDRESPNRVVSRITWDASMSVMPFTLLRMAIMLFTVAIVMMAISSCHNTMLLVMMAGVPVVLILMTVTYKLMALSGFMASNRLSVFTAFLSERLANIKLIKASKAEEAETKKGEDIIDMRYKAGIFNVIASTVVSLASSFNTIAMYVACFLVGAALIKSGAIIDGADLNAAYLYGGFIGIAFSYISQVPIMIGAVSGNLQSIALLHDEKEEDVISGSEAPQEAANIRMENVAFAYKGGRQVLGGASCVIPHGKVTAIVGPNGAGKSTLIKLIDRLYTDYSGDLMMGEVRADAVSLNAWREQFAIVSQNASLFSGSIKDNICYGVDRQPSLEEISLIAHLAHLDELIAKHDEGLDFDIGVGGCRLSGGEQQRLSIARAMMKDPKYLILDEATANLDAKTESQIKASIDTLMKGRTVITIAHNFSAIEQADHILVLNNGSIEGAGTHQELLATCDFYKKLASAGYEV